MVAVFRGCPERCVTTLEGAERIPPHDPGAAYRRKKLFFSRPSTRCSRGPGKGSRGRKIAVIVPRTSGRCVAGARVVNPRAAEASLASGIPIEVRSFAGGETVTSVEPRAIPCENYIVGVASGPEVARITVTGGSEPLHSFHSRVFGLVAAAGVSMDMFSVFGSSVMFTVPMEEGEAVEGILGARVRLRVLAPCSKVSIVGAECTA